VQGHGEVYLPHALARKYPHTATEWGWQYIFPARDVSVDPRSGDSNSRKASNPSKYANIAAGFS
jgi:hypothetical protein